MIIIDAVIAMPSLWAPGPVGLFQVFDLGPPDLRAHVIDCMPHVGGQGVELCPDKPVHDIPALWHVQPRGAWLCADPRPSLPGPAIC